ncbi:MAG: hypothetical protein KUL77_11180 [Thermomonas sp.]|uniref:hypothetical protein n=1 Tax=Thermomonas sp. TaxID=1971895 RepID=UPI001EB9B0E2|nr:hypothetical protein [Thermomonas sp.]MBV2210111.1 hypothetical protein [Thermomonas sp.]
MKLKKQWIALAVSMALAQTAWAQDDSDRFTLSGFGTVGVAHSSERNADVRPDFQASTGVGASDRTSFNLDSRIAVQLNANFTDNLTGVLQAVSEHGVESEYSPKISLAHVKYRFTSNFSARLGRITAPLYMLSEYQRVGYAMPWARPPIEVYDYLLAMDGVDAVYNFHAGDAVIGLQGFYGRIDSKKSDVNAFRGVALNVDAGASSFRISHIRGTVNYATKDINALFDAYESLPIPPLVDYAKMLDPRGVDGKFSGIGYSYDPGKWFMRTEVIQADYGAAIIGKATSGYLSAGMRVGDFTPSLTVAHVDSPNPEAPGALDPLGLLNAAVLSQRSSRHSYGAALRWDVHSNVAVKFQANHVKNHAGSFGGLGNQQPGFVPGRGYNLVSASVDFVF